MFEASAFIHYGSIALTLVFSGLGVAIAQGLISIASLEAIYMQPQASQQISKVSILSMALTETASVLGLVIAIVFLFNTKPLPQTDLFVSIAQAGAIFAIGLVGLVVSLVSALPAMQTMHSISRQPFFADKIMNIMLITMSIIQTPLIFGFIITMLIHLQINNIHSLNDGFKFFAAALCCGLGSLGPAIGQGIFAKRACWLVGVNREAYPRILSFSLLSQSIIETPIIFSLLAALLIYNSAPHPSDLKIVAFIMTGICMGLSNFMPGIGSGKTSAAACKQIGLNHGNIGLISRTSLLAQGLLDTFAIYGLLIGIMLILSPV